MREGVKDVPVLWTIFEIGINLFQSSLYLFFLKSRSHISKPSKAADWVCVLTCTAFYTLYLFFDIPITDSVHIIFLFIYLLIVSDDPWYVSAFWVMVKEAIAIAIVGLMLQLCLILTSGTYEVLMSQGPLRFIFVMLCFSFWLQIFLFCLRSKCCFLYKFRHQIIKIGIFLPPMAHYFFAQYFQYGFIIS